MAQKPITADDLMAMLIRVSEAGGKLATLRSMPHYIDFGVE